MIHGRNLIISMDGETIAAARSCNVNISQDFISVCSPTESRVLDKLPTVYDWNISVDCLLLYHGGNASFLIDKLIAGTKVLLIFTDGGANQRYAGYAYVKSCDESGTVGNLATFRASFESSGPLYKYTEYKTSEFQDGENFELIISGSSLTYNFASTQTSTYGVEITPAKNSLLYIAMDWIYAVYHETFANIKTLIHDESSSALNEKLVAFGDTIGKVVALTAGYKYTILMDDHSGINKLFLMTTI